jgi:ketosteroid isomerase-like protein
MSQEYIENIERAYEAMSRLDAEAMVALCEPDVEFRSRIAEADDVTPTRGLPHREAESSP